MLVGTDDRGIHPGVFVLSLCGKMVANLAPHPVCRPSAMAAGHIVPIPKAFRKIPPGNPGAVPRAPRLDTEPIVCGRHADRLLAAWQ